MKRFDSVFAFLLFIASFVLYVHTLAPSLLFGDSAEFQTIAYTLGIGHPTGYPIYVLLAKLFTFLPVGEIAYRVNLFSAFCAALTVGVVFLMIRKLGATHAAAVYGALALALIPLFWKYASVAEVYAPSAACLALILLFLLQWKETDNPRWLFLVGLFGGLSLGIHTTVALSGVAIFLYLALSTHQWADWRQASVGALAGFSVFLLSFLLLDALNSSAGYYNAVVHPSLSVWGMTLADFDSPFERLAFLYFPPQFKGQFFSVSHDEVKTRLTDFAQESSRNLWLALLGFGSLLVPRKTSPARWREAILLILAFITFLTFAVTYNVFDFNSYYIPAMVVLANFIGLGVNAILEVIALVPKIPPLILTGLAILIVIAGMYPSLDHITSYWKGRTPPGLEDWESYSFQFPDARRLETEKILNGLEKNSIVFTDWDYVYDFYYVAHVLQGHIQTDFHETFPQEGVTLFADSAIAYIEANIDTRPIYFSERPSQLATRYKITRAGSGLFRIERK
jgi:4-amino-4-deoxy-L-arabinose transferase-like glycosyltransferase